MNAAGEGEDGGAAPGFEARRAEVRKRMAALSEVLEQRKRVEKVWITAALALIFAGIPLCAAAFDGLLPVPPWPFLLVLVVAFLVAVARRERATQRRRDTQTRIAFGERALNRLDDRYDAGQDDGTAYHDPEHPYAGDLDVFGPASLFWRLNSCHSVLGRDALAAILRGEDSDAVAVNERQEAVAELAGDWQTREDLDAACAGLVRGISAEESWFEHYERETRELLAWGEGETPPPTPLGAQVVRIVLALFGIAGCAAWISGYGFLAALIPYLINGAVMARQKDIKTLTDAFERVGRTLGAWSEVFRVLEARDPKSPLLRRLRAGLDSDGVTASRAVDQLQRRVARLSWRRNAFWAMSIDVILLWDLHARDGVLAWKRAHGRELRDWFRIAASWEALSALAAWAHGNPDATRPAWGEDQPPYRARELVHPLLPRDQRVANSLEIGAEGSVLLVTGSNMSGKSTFLRSVGLAVVCSRAGLPVLAKDAAFQPLDVVTCMRVHDSLARGSSHFHAEVHRLRACVDRAEAPGRTLVLLDEILSGTNSKERHVGATSVIRSLCALPTLSLVSTHDLGLIEIADELEERMRIVHFRDLVHEGRMAFDYTLREGPVPSTNALRVMRAAGLDVPDDGGDQG